jgi:hypothetical protein
MKKIFPAILYLLLLIHLTSCQESIEERLAKEAQDYTEKFCPQPVDAANIVYIDSMTFEKGNPSQIVYNYSVHADSTAVVEIKKKQQELYQTLLTSVRNSVDLKTAKEEGITIVHHYIQADTKAPIFTFHFTRKDYQ